MRKRLTAVFMCLCMMLTLLPAPAYAAVRELVGNPAEENQALLEELEALTGQDGEAVLELLEAHYQMPPVLYCTEEMWTDYLDGSFEDYPLWIRNVFTKPKISDPWTFWQYTNRGRLEGYAGDEEFIDLNVFYGDETQWEEWLEAVGVR